MSDYTNGFISGTFVCAMIYFILYQLVDWYIGDDKL